MNAMHMPAFIRGSLQRYRFQPIASQWMPYAEKVSIAARYFRAPAGREELPTV